MSQPGVEHATVASVTAAGKVFVHLDRFAPNSAAGPVKIPKWPQLGHYTSTSTAALHTHTDGTTGDLDTASLDFDFAFTWHPYVPAKGDRVLVACIGGSLDDLALLAVLT